MRASRCADAIAPRVSPDFTVTVTTGYRKIAFARLMTRLTLASRVAGGHGSLRRDTSLMSAWVTTVLRLIGRPSARDAEATSRATLSNWASVYGSVPEPEHSIDSWTHSLTFTPDATAAAIGLSLIGLSATQSVENQPERAVQIAAAAEVYAHQEGIVNVYSDETPDREFVDRARASLSDEDDARASEIGRRFTIKQALDLARIADAATA